jgi:putative tricarboxylic transport membrane protein
MWRSRFLSRGARLAAGLAAVALVATGCVGDSDDSAEASGEFPSKTLRIMAPAAPGGGWDQTARTAQTVLKQGVVDKDVEVYNVGGAGGTIGLAQLVTDEGNAHLLMAMGLVMVGAIETNESMVTLKQVTPIARVTGEYEAIVVPANSKYKTLQDLVTDLKADPGKVAIAGGSAGGTDHILAGLLAKEIGVDATKVNYVAFSGGGEALAAILGGKVAAGISGIGEFAEQVKAGKLRALAVSSPSRTPALDAPTIKEQGIDVELANWRGFVAPPGVSETDRDALIQILTQMHDSKGWKDALAKNGWEDVFLAGDEFASYLADEQTRVEGILADLGLV